MNVTAGRILLGAFLVTNAAGLTLMAVVDITHLSHASYKPILKACVILPVPKTLIAAVYGSGVRNYFPLQARPLLMRPLYGKLFFESAVFISTMINVLHKPRNSHTTLATLLYRDGCLFFIVRRTHYHSRTHPNRTDIMILLKAVSGLDFSGSSAPRRANESASGLRFANTVVMVVSRESTNYLVNQCVTPREFADDTNDDHRRSLVWVFVLILLNRLVRNQCRGRKGSEHRALGSNANGMGVIIAREVDVELDTFCRSTRSTM